MIFAFGAQRSGTWWLQRMLTAHPAVSAVPSETYLFSDGIKPLFARFHHGLRSSTTVGQIHVERDVLLDATRDFCDRVLEPYLEPGSRYLSERSPGHARALEEIAAVYPDARLIHIIRDGRDVARSLAAREWGPGSIAAAAREWRETVEAARAAAPAENYLELRYETLVGDLETGLRGLYEWLGLAAGADVVEPALREARRPLNEDPKDTRVAAGKWRDHFSADDVAAFEAEAGDLAAELGYVGPTARPAVLTATAPVPTSLKAPRARPGAARALRERLRRTPEQPQRPAVNQEVGGALGTASRIADTVLAALQTGNAHEVRAVLADDATLRILDPDGERRVHGPLAVTDELAADPAFRGHQLRGEAHPGIPQFTLVLAYALPEGGGAARVLVLDVRGPRVEALTLHRMPWPAT